MRSKNLLKKTLVLLLFLLFLMFLNFPSILKFSSINDIILLKEAKADEPGTGKWAHVDCTYSNGVLVIVCSGTGILKCQCAT